MSQSGIAQINARVPRDLKATGDQGLQALGLSPSDAIRRLWTRLSARGKDLEHVGAFLRGEESAAKTRETPFEQSELAQGCVVLAAAQCAKVDHLVTFDQDLIRKAPVSALLPSDMLTLLEM